MNTFVSFNNPIPTLARIFKTDEVAVVEYLALLDAFEQTVEVYDRMRSFGDLHLFVFFGLGPIERSNAGSAGTPREITALLSAVSATCTDEVYRRNLFTTLTNLEDVLEISWA